MTDDLVFQSYGTLDAQGVHGHEGCTGFDRPVECKDDLCSAALVCG
jgi:hypothetical protein